MIQALLAEIIGTFFFISTILATGEAFAIGLSLAVAIWAFSKVSKGSFNPAVSIALFLRGNLDAVTTAGYIVAEIIGAILAYMWWSATIGAKK